MTDNDNQEKIDCNGDPCIWCCFPCIFTMITCETCCKAICMFICCIQPDSVKSNSIKPNTNLSIEIPPNNEDNTEGKKEYYTDMFSTEIK